METTLLQLFKSEPRKRGRKKGTKNPKTKEIITSHIISKRALAQLIGRNQVEATKQDELRLKKILLRMKLQETWFQKGFGESRFEGNLFITEFPGMHNRRIEILR